MLGFDMCDLKHSAMNTVFSDGNPESKIMLVGEAPGADEDKQGLPFVGQSGQLLDKALKTIKLDRTNVYISNIIPWRPPGNRPPTNYEISICLPFIKKHIEIIQPEILVLVGGVSAKALLDTNEGILKLRGEWQEYRTESGKAIKTIATYHPAYLMRSPSQKALVWQDMLRIEDGLKK